MDRNVITRVEIQGGEIFFYKDKIFTAKALSQFLSVE